jgi:hypothetical protein
MNQRDIVIYHLQKILRNPNNYPHLSDDLFDNFGDQIRWVTINDSVIHFRTNNHYWKITVDMEEDEPWNACD